MPDHVASFNRELIRAANEVEQLTSYERANLLQRSAATIRDLREQAGSSQSGIDAEDVVHSLRSMAETIDQHGPSEIAAMMLQAVAAIKAGRSELERSLDAEYQQLIDELNNPDRAT